MYQRARDVMLSITNGEKQLFQFRITKNFTARAVMTKIFCRYVERRRYFDMRGCRCLVAGQTSGQVFEIPEIEIPTWRAASAISWI